jgi:hypothetical protein
MAKGMATGHPDFFFFFIKIKNYGQYKKFGIKLVKLQKNGSLNGALQKLKH